VPVDDQRRVHEDGPVAFQLGLPGAAGVLVEIGTEDPDVDADRVRQLREAVPDGAWFEISGCGRYDYASALWLGLVFEDEFAADGFADPVAPTDLPALKRLTDNLTLGVSTGALYDRVDDFTRAMETGGPGSYHIDPFRLGGFTPARKVAVAAELRHAAICPVKVPHVGVHLAAAGTLGRVVETVDWFDDVFTGGPVYKDGQLLAPMGPGLGFDVDEKTASKYRV
jgi:L-alanine-DL-glutamate epimerase-like enolase superfamily enzyme